MLSLFVHDPQAYQMGSNIAPFHAVATHLQRGGALSKLCVVALLFPSGIQYHPVSPKSTRIKFLTALKIGLLIYNN